MQYIVENGGTNKGNHESAVLAGHPVTVDTRLSDEQRRFVEEVIRGTNPVMKACWANSLRAWHEYPRFDYVEGYAMACDLEFPFEHAWLTLEGKLVDLTTDGFDHYCGVTFSDEELLTRYYDIGAEEEVWGVLKNTQRNLDFLRSQGYL